jgi:hypothetical protein
MVKATIIGAEGRVTYLFGLSAKNLEKLREGKPISFDLEPLGGFGHVYIMYGETEAHIAAELQAVGKATS